MTRLLHARHAKGSATLLSEPHALSLSPVLGLLLHRSSMLSVLWEAGGCTTAPATARLARQLFHRNEPQEPLRPTRNRSLAAAHLTPSLAGHLLGLSLCCAAEAEVRSVLQRQGVNELARRTRVSIARFVRLQQLLRDSLEEAPTATTPATTPTATKPATATPAAAIPAALSGTSVLLAFLWSSATSKACLLDFYLATAQHMPPHSLLALNAKPGCQRWRQAWTLDSFSANSAVLATPAEVRAVLSHAPSASALELLGFVLCSGGSERPEIVQERHGYRGEAPHVPDCVEACVREVLSLVAWDADLSDFDADRYVSGNPTR